MAKASHFSDSHYHRGEMDIKDQAGTYAGFMAMSKWGSLVLAVGLLFVTIWFCTGAGFGAAIITAVIAGVLGFVLLKGGKATH